MCAVCDEHVIPMMWVWSVWFGARHDSIHNPGILHSSCYCEGMKDTVMAHTLPSKDSNVLPLGFVRPIRRW